MRLTADQFLNQPKKSITFIGMSGLGKTHTSSMLAREGWTHYSCDEVIGKNYLAKELDAPVTKDDLSPLSRFVGKLGDPAKGGLPLVEFKRRQALYYDAECESLRQVGAEIAASPGHFVNDSTGSLCEIVDEVLLEQVGSETLFIYIRANADDEVKILQRAVDYPKPMFFPSSEFDYWLSEYMNAYKIEQSASIDPDSFARWVFPVLFRSRLPKYRKLAQRYGIIIESEDMQGVETETGFINLVAKALSA